MKVAATILALAGSAAAFAPAAQQVCLSCSYGQSLLEVGHQMFDMSHS